MSQPQTHAPATRRPGKPALLYCRQAGGCQCAPTVNPSRMCLHRLPAVASARGIIRTTDCSCTRRNMVLAVPRYTHRQRYSCVPCAAARPRLATLVGPRSSSVLEQPWMTCRALLRRSPATASQFSCWPWNATTVTTAEECITEVCVAGCQEVRVRCGWGGRSRAAVSCRKRRLLATFSARFPARKTVERIWQGARDRNPAELTLATAPSTGQ
jgi:hypothetical protein